MRLPECSFYLFGMGDRRKLLYRGGALLDALTGETVRRWEAKAERILPSEYRVEIETADGGAAVVEDEEGVWIEEAGERVCVTASRLLLPRFEGNRRASLLRVLHQEVLANIVPAGPVPNFFVYRQPWHRDAAMMAMCLERTGNLRLIEEWVRGLEEPFDRNNGGDCEPDNLGQVLYLISLVADSSHPLVGKVLDLLPGVTRGKHITGPTDGAERPVYQTKWLKYGLRRLGLDDPYEIPEVFDSYSALFWMDYREEHVEGPRFEEKGKELYPYLGWAEAHFHGEPPPMELCGEGYPLSWEASASQADYEGMRAVSAEYVARRICAPHTWHAAEMFLYLMEAG
jgi:hypothetical protein